MSKHGSIKRYYLVIDKIGRNQYPSFENIKAYLFSHGFEISSRTIQRDIEQIRFEFGLNIKYNRVRNGYYIDTASSINIDAFLRFLEIVDTAELLTDSLNESKDTLNYIAFESNNALRGIENLRPLLYAIKNHRKVSFVHENFETGLHREYAVKPYLLKEYQNRWYLVGIKTGRDDFRTFGIDRMRNLVVRDLTFRPNPKLNPIDLFENIIGVTYSAENPEEVILSFTPLQGKYVKALPFHHSQEIIEDDAKEFRIRLWIVPNYEFKQKILMLGETVHVQRPKWFAEEVKESLQAAINQYK